MRVEVVSHTFVTGPSQELVEYLKKRTRRLVFIGHPFNYCKDIRSFIEVYENGYLKTAEFGTSWRLPQVYAYLKDVLYTLIWTLKTDTKYDLYVGVDPLNCLLGLIFRRLGRTEKVVLYTIDYVPARFGNPLLNGLYHLVDSLCASKADVCWNLSPRMSEARKKRGIKARGKEIVVPIGVRLDRIKRRQLNELHRHRLVYLGHLRENQGLELIVETMPSIVREVRDATLLIIGTGPLEPWLKNTVKQLELTQVVKFTGFVKDHAKVEDLLATSGVGLALYKPSPTSFTWFADPSKPAQYLACGLPVIITNVPRIAEEIAVRPMGIVTNYDSHDFAKAALKLLTDDELYKTCRDNALQYVSQIDWNVIFENALRMSG